MDHQLHLLLNKRISLLQSLRGKLNLIFLLLAFIPLIVVGILLFLLVVNANIAQTKTHLSEATSLHVEALDTWLNERTDDMITLANTDQVRSMELAQAQKEIDRTYRQWEDYESIFVVRPNGKILTSTGRKQAEITDLEYFQVAMKGNTFISDPMISKVTGDSVVVFAAPVKDSDRVIGVVAGSIPLSRIADTLMNSWYGDTGDAYLINKDGLLISPSRFNEQLKAAGLAKNTAELEVKVNTIVAPEVLAGLTGIAEYPNMLGKNVLGAFQPLTEKNWGLIVEQDKDEALASINNMGYITLGVALVIIVLVNISSLLFSKFLAEPLQFLTEALGKLSVGELNRDVKSHADPLLFVTDTLEKLEANKSNSELFQKVKQKIMKRKDEYGIAIHNLDAAEKYLIEVADMADKLSNGDLTFEIKPRSELDEIGISLNRMLRSLKELISGVSENAANVAKASTDLSDAAAQSGSATNQIAATIQQVAKGNGQQTESVARTANSVDQLARAIDGVARGAQEQATAVNKVSSATALISNIIDQVTGNVNIVSQNASNAAQTAENGATTVQETIHSMQAIQEKVTFSAEKVQEMGSRSSQIGAIVETIDDIASQTNLLALNAAIEAARAGEQGKGFAVVADEVRKLAERSSNATDEIRVLVAGIQKTVTEAIEAMQASSAEVTSGTQHTSEASAALDEILKTVQAVADQAQQASEAVSRMNRASDELISATDAVSAVVEQNTAATEEMSASSNEVSQAIENIASISEENAAAVEQISASIEEVSAQVQEVGAAVTALSSMAGSLQQTIHVFRISQSNN